MTDLTRDPAILEDWIGRTETRESRILPQTAHLLAATLDLAPDAASKTLPPLWHWAFFPPDTPTAELGPDGHPRLGHFLPPVDLPRRMWAGGRFRFHAPIPVGATLSKHSEITAVKMKQGRSGPLCFVTVRHDFSTSGTQCLTEEHDIVYRAATAPDSAAPTPAPPPQGAQSTRTITPTMPLLFRYSALTFNAHRIHYDLDYCREVEHYPGCIVHGPLIATWLAALATEITGPLASFAFRAMAPLFHDAPFTIAGKHTETGAEVWAATPTGALAMHATAAPA